jgi:hypothetical protein
MTQDGTQREDDTWLFTKYDVLDRPIITGSLYYISGTGSWTRENVQDHVNNSEASLYEMVDLESETGYTGFSYPMNRIIAEPMTTYSTDEPVLRAPAPVDLVYVNYLTLTYYDNYDLVPSADFEYSKPVATGLTNISAADFDEALTDIPGLTAMTKVRNLETYDWSTSVTYYDKKYRPIQVISQNQFDDIDRINTSYIDFTGDIASVVSQHMANSSNIIIGERYKYGVDGRLYRKYYQLSGSEEFVMSHNTFNELGQLEADYTQGKINSGGIREFLQKTDYRYNIRGWMTFINQNMGSNGENDMFSLNLAYDQPQNFSDENTKAQFNGNISAMSWMNAYDNKKQFYAFDYDGLNRLKSAQHGTPSATNGNIWEKDNAYTVPKIDYDANGNILALQRNGENGTLIDNLEYAYKNDTENQLVRVNDGSGNSLGLMKFRPMITMIMHTMPTAT